MFLFLIFILGNIGDIGRELRRIGIILTHKQTYIDEFDYAFRNLAIDLRDGVRLTKVMEIILLRDDMTCQMRAPAISRTQRLFNVGVALKALENADFVLSGNTFFLFYSAFLYFNIFFLLFYLKVKLLPLISQMVIERKLFLCSGRSSIVFVLQNSMRLQRLFKLGGEKIGLMFASDAKLKKKLNIKDVYLL